MANTHLGIDDRKILKDRIAKSDYEPWPRPVVAFYAGNADEATMRASAIIKAAPSTTREQLCEANYYAGTVYLAKGKQAKALPLLRDAATKCPMGYVELYAARRELKRLGE